MTDVRQVEVVIETNDRESVSEIQQILGSLQPTPARPVRVVDPLTVLAIAAATVKLVNELLALKQKLRDRQNRPRVKVRTVSGASVDLVTTTREELSALIDAVS